MTFSQLFSSILILFILCLSGPGQQPSDAKPTTATDEAQEKLDQDAVAFMRHTLQDIGSMRTIENRISFTSELAGLMWYHDEREARAMFSGVVNEFKTLLAQYDSQMNALEMTGVALSRRGGGLFGPEPTDHSRLNRKARIAAGVRQQIAMSLAEHVPELALNFFYDSLSIVSNEGLRTQLSSGDSNFEYTLISRVAEKSVDRAVELADDSLKKGLKHNHIALLRTIYDKDQDKGIAYGGKVLSAFKNTHSNNLNDYIASSLLDLGIEKLDASKSDPSKKPLYSDGELRDIADILASQILKPGDRYERWSALRYAQSIEKVLPGRAAQIRAKFPEINQGSGSGRGRNNSSFGAAPALPRHVSTAGVGTGDQSMTGEPKPTQEEIAKAKAEERLKQLGTKELPKEEREKIVAEARKLINESTSNEAKLLALNILAAQVSRAGDGQLASEIMLEASRLVNPYPKHVRDLLMTWILISGYAETEPEKAFDLIESTIFRVNDLAGAAIKIGEFVDVNEEMFVDGEVQVGAFGGDMIRGMTGTLGIAENTVATLAKTDFTKTRALTDRFERVEARVLAKMLVLRAVLGKNEKSNEKDSSGMTGLSSKL